MGHSQQSVLHFQPTYIARGVVVSLYIKWMKMVERWLHTWGGPITLCILLIIHVLELYVVTGKCNYKGVHATQSLFYFQLLYTHFKRDGCTSNTYLEGGGRYEMFMDHTMDEKWWWVCAQKGGGRW